MDRNGVSIQIAQSCARHRGSRDAAGDAGCIAATVSNLDDDDGIQRRMGVKTEELEVTGATLLRAAVRLQRVQRRKQQDDGDVSVLNPCHSVVTSLIVCGFPQEVPATHAQHA